MKINQSPIQSAFENDAYNCSQETLLSTLDDQLRAGVKINQEHPGYFLTCCKKNFIHVVAKIMLQNHQKGIDLSGLTLDDAWNASDKTLPLFKTLLLNARKVGWTVLQRHVDQYLRSAFLQDSLEDIEFILKDQGFGVRASFFDLEEQGESCYALSSGTKHKELLEKLVASNECFVSKHWAECPLYRSIQKRNLVGIEFWISYFSEKDTVDRVASAFISNKLTLQGKYNFDRQYAPGENDVFWQKINETLSKCSFEMQKEVALVLENEEFAKALPCLMSALSKRSLLEGLPEDISQPLDKKPRSL